jgi:hypothetical protein
MDPKHQVVRLATHIIAQPLCRGCPPYVPKLSVISPLICGNDFLHIKIHWMIWVENNIVSYDMNSFRQDRKANHKQSHQTSRYALDVSACHRHVH